jgi:oligoribonuclease (3'-5' exoribonuclease)
VNAPVCFVDCETTGLDPDRHEIWEVGLITPDGEFLRGRLRFIESGDDAVRPNARPPFGCCLLIWGTA